ncbi:MAG: TetR/AcrR family transcriptional regulator [Actinomycetota bacterium]
MGATFDLIAKRGVGGVSMEAVATRAGVGKATIYRRWPTKAALIKEGLATYARQQVPMPDTGTIRGDLVALLRSIIGVYSATVIGRIFPDILAEAFRCSELAEALREFWTSRRQVMFEVLVRGVDRGELPADIDCKLTNELLLGPIYYRFLISRHPLMPEQADDIVAAVLHGVSLRS